MDVVYAVRAGERNEELRYSLRSLVNLEHDRVWIVGHCPSWLTGVRHIAVRQVSNKYRNSTANVRAACASRDVSDPFIYMNDDFFVLRPTTVPNAHRGLVTEVIEDYRSRKQDHGPYIRGAVATLGLMRDMGLTEPLSYELHVPFLVHKKAMLEALGVGRGVAVLHKRTLYGNLARLGGRKMADPKIVDLERVPAQGQQFVSTNDASFTHGRVGEWLRQRFTQPSANERTAAMAA